MRFFYFLTVFFFSVSGWSSAVEAPLGSEGYKFEINANAYRNGETIELGLISPKFFKFKSHSRHYWSAFGTIGLNTLSNIMLPGKTNVDEEVLNLEAMLGVMAQAQFYKNHITQYGKVAIDAIQYDDDIEKDVQVGAVFESGLAFHSLFGANDEVSKSSLHIGLRWRFGFSPLESLAGQPDLAEGISFVIGSRVAF